MQNREDIDVVITWVDGNDAAHKQKMQPFLNKLKHIGDDIAGPTRFRSEGEIFFCVASIFRFAPFVRKIFIVTDNQNPELQNFIQIHFPQSTIQLEIVDHSTIFKGNEDCLPVFNSISIESCLFRIPDLTENFVYFNDDFLLVRPIRPHDWFIDNKPVAYGYWRNITLDQILWYLKPKIDGLKPFGYKDSIMNAAKAIGQKGRYFYMMHAPQPMTKSVLEHYFSQNPQILSKNISHKFRHNTQFNPQALFYLLAFKTGYCIQNAERKMLFLKPVNRNKTYIDKKINALEENQAILFCCIESLDMAEKQDQQKIFSWLSRLLNVKNTIE